MGTEAYEPPAALCSGGWRGRERQETEAPQAKGILAASAAIDILEARLFGEPLAVLYERMADHPGLAHLTVLIEERHADPDLSHPVAARECALEKNYLNVRLRVLTGLTFHRLLTRRRLLRAAELLAMTNRQISEIATASGFGSRNSFERNFSRAAGTPPGRFRRQFGKVANQ